MYNVIITTKYNIIKLQVDDIENATFKEIIEQPYVIDVKIEECDINSAFVKKLKI